MFFHSNFLIGFVKTYSKVLIAIYIWAFCGFLIPNLELNKSYLPESTKYKSIILMMIGAFIFTILGYCFSLLAVYIIIFIFIYRWITFASNMGLLDMAIDENSTTTSTFIFVPILSIMSAYKKEIDLLMKILVSIDFIYQVIRGIYNFFIREESQVIEKIPKKSILNTSEHTAVERNKEIRSAITDLIIGAISYPFLATLYMLIVGILLFLLIEYFSIWTLNFSSFFLIICTYITIYCFND